MTKDPKKVDVTDAQKQVYDTVCKRLIEVQSKAINHKLCYNQTDLWASCSVSERQRLMATLEERIQALEQENTARKKTEELLTIAVRALVSKEAFEKLQEAVERSQEQNNRLFDVLNNHNVFTNERLADIQNQIVELDGKIVGQQTETRQLQNQIVELDGKIVGQQTEMRQRFTQAETKQTELDSKVVGLQTTQADHTTLLQQILARLPEKS